MPERLRLGLATVLMLSGIKLVDPPGVDWVIAAAIAAGIAFGLWGLLRRLGRRPPAETATKPF
ncbi:MAG TPA: hypothetical protein VK287_04990 [Gaiellaceae bacterium]|nr:hypothetical protein [Gaiellaceae bacterium]